MAETTPATPQRKIQTKASEDWDDEILSDKTDGDKRRSNDVSPQHGRQTKSRLEYIDKEESSPRTPQRNIVDGLRAWSESPTSPRHRTPHGHRSNRIGKHEERENWDDDFIDSTDSPARQPAPKSMSTPGGPHSRTTRQPRVGPEAEEENWDEDFEMDGSAGASSPGAGPSSRSKRLRRDRGRDVAWDSSDEEIEDFDREMGFDRNDEEDKTVTSRSRRKPLSLLTNDVPPLPALPNFLPTIPSGDVPGPYTSPPSPFPRSSPSHSVFSIPATTNSGHRDSTYGSTAHLALSLRRTHSAESSPSSPMRHKFVDASRFPTSPEAPRERRRLRKKSRPPHLDSSILELDDRAEPFLRPLTPDSRPCTPPPPSSGVILSPTTPSSSAQASSLLPVPMSPTSASKSPLLARIGSMRRWGRKRTSISQDFSSTSPEATHSAHRQIGGSPTANGESVPPSSFLAGALDAEADRFDHNRTPRPHSHVASILQPPPISPMPPHPPAIAGTNASTSAPRTPSRNRFFRGVSGGMEVSTPASSRSSLADKRPNEMTSRAKSHEREQLRVAIPNTIPLAAQSSQSGESELGSTNIPASPRRDRIRAFGQKLLHSKRSASASSPDRGKGSSEGEPSRMSMHEHSQTYVPARRQVSTPLSGETPTRLRPRIPGSHQAPTMLGHGKARQVFPRHVSGSALKERRSNCSFVGAPGMGSRSVSATDSIGMAASSDDLAHSSDGHKASDEKGGYRGLMGSMRRISLVGVHAQKLQQEPEVEGYRIQSRSRPRSPVPPLPPIPVDPSTLSSQLLPPLGILSSKSSKKVPSSVATTISGSGIDLTSPTTENAPSDWLSSVSSPVQAPGPRRSGDLPTLTHSKSSSFATSSSSPSQTAAHRLSSASQAASLGRASPLPIGAGAPGDASANANGNVFRRNSLGDLKIPTRISKAQDGLKRDLGRVREFASRVEQMQDLRTSYFNIATQIQLILDTPRPPSRATSPTANIFSLSRSNSRARSNTNPPPLPTIDYRGLGLAFQAIDVKYSVAWECADLLIELGTGSVAESSQAPAPDTSNGNAKPSAPVITRNGSTNSRGKNRERAVTLAGDEGKPDLSSMDITSPKSPSPGSLPALVSWRASTAGRQDLGHRQLYLLKEMLSNADSAREGARLDIPELLTAPQFGLADEAMDSTLTLPTEESEVVNQTPGSPVKKRRGSRLIGIRDMLRSLKRSTVRAIQNQPEGVAARSSTTLNTDSSFDSHARQFDSHPYNTVAGIPFHPPNLRRKSETSAALIESIRSPVPDYNPFVNGIPLTHKSSPRRPSLASLFRLGQKHKAAASGSHSISAEQSAESSNRTDLEIGVSRADASREGDASDDIDDSDWDRMDSMSDVDAQLAAIADGASGQGSTLKQRKKKQQNRLSMPPPRPVTPKHNNHPFSASQGSFASVDQSLGNARSPRLSNVDENNISMISGGSGAISGRQTPATPESSRRSRSRAGKDRDRERQFSSVRTVPPKPNKGIPSFDAPGVPVQPAPDLKLAMTPENIKPLLENARVVTARLHDCLAEVKGLLIRTEGSAFTLSTAASSSNVALGPSAQQSNISS